MLHPCQTTQIMQLLMGDASDNGDSTGGGHLNLGDLDSAPTPDIEDLEADVAGALLRGEGGCDSSWHGHPWGMPEDAPDDLLLRYMYSWLRVAGTVVGLRFDLADLRRRP